jgi:hypothetical protein
VGVEWDTGELVEVSWEDLTIEPLEVRYSLGSVHHELAFPRWRGPACGALVPV